MYIFKTNIDNITDIKTNTISSIHTEFETLMSVSANLSKLKVNEVKNDNYDDEIMEEIEENENEYEMRLTKQSHPKRNGRNTYCL